MKKIERDIENQVHSKLAEHNNEQFLDELLNVQKKNNQQKPVKKRFKFLSTLITCSLVVVIAISLSIYYLIPNEPTKKEYSVANQYSEDISIDELNKSLSDITVLDKDLVLLTKCSDSYYNETLFYVLYFETEDILISTHIIIVVNPDYPNIYNGSCYETTTLNGYEIQYFVDSSFEEELYNYRVCAKMNVGNQRIFIDYDEFAFEEGNSFLDYIAQIIK